MSSIVRVGGSSVDQSADLRGLTTDTKPTRAGGQEVPHGSIWFNMDDSTRYMYNANTDAWYRISDLQITDDTKVSKSSIAPIEDTLVATQAYAIGDEFWISDTLYMVTAPIAQGDGIVIGTNCEVAAKLVTQIKNIKDDVSDLEDKVDNIAPTEATTTASQSYAVGEQFFYDDNLMTATSPISQNDAFIVYPTSGYNCKLSDSVTGQIKAVKDGLGTASAKNSTSVVTNSTDLVESGAVKDIVGWGNKNLFDPANIRTEVTASYVPLYVGSGVFTMSTNMPINTQGEANLFILAGNVSTGASTAINGVWSGQTRTVTAIDGYVTVASRNADGVNPVNYNHQLEKGSTATSYEPYHASVADNLEEKADNSVIGTVEDGTTASQAYDVGEHFIRNGAFCTVTSAISANESLVGSSKFTSGDVAGNIADIYANIGLLTTPVSAVVANSLPVLKRNITSDFYNGSLRGEIASGNFKNVRAGDYIIGQSTGSTYYVACIDWMFNKGDQTNATYQAQAYGQHHLGLMLFKPVGTTSLWLGKGDAGGSWQVSANDKGRCPWNAATDVDPTSTSAVGSNDTNITRTYGGASVSGYMGSFIRERMDAILLPQCFQADFGSSNVLKFRNLNGNAITTDKPSGGQGNWNGCTTGWAWYDRYLDLPSEVEVYGSRVFGSAYDIGVQCERLPMFKNADINAFYPRLDFWTKAVAGSSSAASRYSVGIAGGAYASGAYWACPLACVR